MSRYSKFDIEKLGLLYESINKNVIDNSIRQKITQGFTTSGLDGNGRFKSAGQALSVVNSVLDSLGFELDMVSNDIEIAQAHHHPGMKGQRLIAFRRKSTTNDPFYQEPEIENSAISFNFENLGRNDDKPIEVVAYAS